jgi:GNAT superfamily N-acetyltransferase
MPASSTGTSRKARAGRPPERAGFLPVGPVGIRRCTAADIEALRAAGDDRIRHHEMRFDAQEQGWCDYLLAFRDDDLVGHVVVRCHSKYPRVVQRLGEFREVNALAAFPTGQGVGALLLAAAEGEVRGQGGTRVGLAVEHGNPARRLYERAGYVDWGHGDVVDDWDEVANDGTVVASHHEVCGYLVKGL